MSKLLLLSGGLDSAVIAHTEAGITLCVGFDYGQAHKIELDKAEAIANKRSIEFLRVALPNMPKVNDLVFAGRNAVLLAAAGGIAQARGISQLLIGCNKSDHEMFPDCRIEFIRGMNQALAAYGVNVSAPLLSKTKAEVVAMAISAGIHENDTWTCYSPDEGQPCGLCYACLSLEAAHV